MAKRALPVLERDFCRCCHGTDGNCCVQMVVGVWAARARVGPAMHKKGARSSDRICSMASMRSATPSTSSSNVESCCRVRRRLTAFFTYGWWPFSWRQTAGWTPACGAQRAFWARTDPRRPSRSGETRTRTRGIACTCHARQAPIGNSISERKLLLQNSQNCAWQLVICVWKQFAWCSGWAHSLIAVVTELSRGATSRSVLYRSA